jgi:hypothetical protein
MRELLPVLLGAALLSHGLLLAFERRGRAAWRLPLLALLSLAAALALRFAAGAPEALRTFADAFALVALAASAGAADARADEASFGRHLHLACALGDGLIGALAYAWLTSARATPMLAAMLAAIAAFALAWPPLQARLAEAPLSRAWREGPATLLALAFPALALAGLASLRG